MSAIIDLYPTFNFSSKSEAASVNPITHQVLKHLINLKDLSNCRLTSKAWSSVATPQLLINRISHNPSSFNNDDMIEFLQAYGHKYEKFQSSSHICLNLELLPNLSSFKYSGAPLFRNLDSLQKLKRLHISYGYPRDISIDLFDSIKKLQHLVHLHLSNVDFDDKRLLDLFYWDEEASGSVYAVPHLKKLTSLSLEGCRITDIGLSLISKFGELKKLSLKNCKQITAQGLNNLTSKYLNLNLTLDERLDKSYNNKIFFDMDTVSDILKSLSYKDLKLASLINKNWHKVFLRERLDRLFQNTLKWYMGDKAGLLDLLSNFPNLPSLKVLQNSRYSFDEVAKFTNLLHLEFTCYERDVVDISTIVHLTKLQSLSLSGCAINQSFKSMTTSLTNLTRLDLSSSEMITDENFPMLAHFKKIRNLNLDFCTITNTKLMCLSTLENLSILKMNHAQFRDEDIKALSLFTNLSSLNLYSNHPNCSITNESLSTLLPLTNLTVLNLDGNHNFTDDQALFNLAKKIKFGRLNVFDQSFTSLDELKNYLRM